MTNETLISLAGTQLWQITLLVVVVGAGTRTVLRRRPHVVYLLWAVVFVKCLTPPLWSSPTSVFSWLAAQQDTVAAVVVPVDLQNQLLQRETPRPQPGPILNNLQSMSLSVDDPEEGAELPAPWGPMPAAPAPLADVGRLVAMAVVFWLSGAVLLLAAAVCRWWDVYRDLCTHAAPAEPALADRLTRIAAKLGVRRHVRLMVTSSNHGPTVFGLYRPVVILPRVMVERVSPEKLDPILAHELVHLRRGDTVLGALQFAAQVCWWFHPLVWWASREANRVCEQCCDEQAVAGLRCRPASYAEALIDVLELKSRLRSGLPMPGVRAVDITAGRLQHVMQNAKRFHARTPLLYWFAAAVLSFVVLPGAQLRLGETPQRPSQPSYPSIMHALQAGDFQYAELKSRELLAAHPEAHLPWLYLGLALHGQGRYEEALAAYRRAEEDRRVRTAASYNTACVYALQGRDEESLAWLERALDLGFLAIQRPLGDDMDFASLRDDPRFQQLEERARPPYALAPPRQLDFLVGEWEVFDSTGQRVGVNRFEKSGQDSLLAGYWKSRRGQEGLSLDYYDDESDCWRRTWLDGRGTVLSCTGGFDERAWCMRGEGSRTDGTKVLTRMTLQPQVDGSLVQHVSRSHDGGHTWEQQPPLVYVRRAEEAVAHEEPAPVDATAPIITLSRVEPRYPA